MRADSIARARQDSINRAQPGYIVDSILPPEEEIRRFRAAIGGDAVTQLNGGARSREELVRRFVRSLAANDSTDLALMAVSVREFADLYYPGSILTRPPYRQSPSLAWTMIQNSSRDGLSGLRSRFGGKRLTYQGHRCAPKPVREGQNVYHVECEVSIVNAQGAIETRRMFGTILERNGNFKFLSYANRM